MAKRLGVIPHVFARPLFASFDARGKPAFEIVTDSATNLALKLRNNEIDAAFLSPVDFAREYSEYRLLPGVSAASEGRSDAAVLLFHEQARSITTVAANPGYTAEIVLAHIVLVEKFGSAPTMVPTLLSPPEALRTADAALAVGDAALSLKGSTNKIDLTDEWMDLTELPFVHGVWAAREGVLTTGEIDAIIDSCRKGVSLVGSAAGREGADYFTHFRYELDDRVQTALTEFLRMAYYHGIIGDIPDVKFLPGERYPAPGAAEERASE